VTNQIIWIGVVVGVFFAGLGIGYAMFYSTQPNFTHMTPQQMQQMMNNPQSIQQMHDLMMNDPNHMQQMHQMMMQSPQHMNTMMGTMMQNSQFGSVMMGQMMNNPNTMNGMVNQMMNNPQFMNTMMGTMMQNQNFQQQYMGPWMMMRDSQFMHNMRGQWFQETNLESSAVQTNQVSILADTWRYQSTKAYSPSVIKVSTGTTVTWTNDDTIIHTVTDLGNEFDSGFIQAGETWQYTFDTKDTYHYFCSIHPWMRGTVLVS
jgi:plastocyanin